MSFLVGDLEEFHRTLEVDILTLGSCYLYQRSICIMHQLPNLKYYHAKCILIEKVNN